jgi:putative sigma-54 modulation protein
MNINISSLHFDADRKLEEFIEKKLTKVVTRYSDVTSVGVVLKLENVSDDENKIAEIKVDLKGKELFVNKQSRSFEEATDNAVEALRRQLKKYKEKKMS